MITLVPISAPFDQFWHTIFGVEDLSRPISLSWSPPHMMISLASVFSLIALLPVIRLDPNKNMRTFFGILAFGTMAAPAQFLMMPFHPTEGWGQVLGFWGAGVFSAPLIGLPLLAKQWVHTKAAATRTMIIAMIFWLLMYGKETAPEIILLPHDRAKLAPQPVVRSPGRLMLRNLKHD